MPITMHVDYSRRRVFTYASGIVTYRDFTRHLDDEELAAGGSYPELVDVSRATLDLTPDELRALAARTQDFLDQGPVGPTAVVATEDANFGLARMFGALAERDGIRIAVFRSVVDAERWLASIERGESPSS